jgi:molybdopterin-guanine dinucleotide biosynthesis protein MobB
MSPPIVSIIGKSNSGKTTLIEKLIIELRRRGYRVATIKHHVHTDEWSFDTPGKDSYRHAQAGAEKVVLIAPSTTVTYDYPARPPSPQEVTTHITGVDLVMAEGFSQARLPAIEISRAARNAPLIGDPDYVLAVAADHPVDSPRPVFGLDDVTGLVDLIARELLGRTSTQSGT